MRRSFLKLVLQPLLLLLPLLLLCSASARAGSVAPLGGCRAEGQAPRPHSCNSNSNGISDTVSNTYTNTNPTTPTTTTTTTTTTNNNNNANTNTDTLPATMFQFLLSGTPEARAAPRLGKNDKRKRPLAWVKAASPPTPPTPMTEYNDEIMEEVEEEEGAGEEKGGEGAESVAAGQQRFRHENSGVFSSGVGEGDRSEEGGFKGEDERQGGADAGEGNSALRSRKQGRNDAGNGSGRYAAPSSLVPRVGAVAAVSLRGGGGAGAGHPGHLSDVGDRPSAATETVGVDLGGRKKGDLAVRTRSTLILVGSFCAIVVQLKQTGCAILVAFLQWALFREGMAIVRDEVSEVLLEAEKGGGKSLRRRQWGVFWVLGFGVYGSLLTKELGAVAAPSAWMVSFCRWHTPAFAALYVGLLLEFITSLRSPPLIMYQLGQLSAAHFACFLVLPSALVSFAARAGLFWFVIPAASVIINDIMAYICGRLFGKTPLTVLSPKKTREGFVGAAICTSVTGWLLGRWLGGVGWLNSPRNVMLLGQESTMDLGGMFERTIGLPLTGLTACPAEIHAFWIAMMASLIGPFGGFLASGIKRAYGVKDFGDTIPGHGGAGDRFDCQVMLLPLVFFYLRAFAPELDI